jgi:hypothetical protein
MQLPPMFHYLKASGTVPTCELKTSKNFPQTLPERRSLQAVEILFKSIHPSVLA